MYVTQAFIDTFLSTGGKRRGSSISREASAGAKRLFHEKRVAIMGL